MTASSASITREHENNLHQGTNYMDVTTIYQHYHPYSTNNSNPSSIVHAHEKAFVQQQQHLNYTTDSSFSVDSFECKYSERGVGNRKYVHQTNYNIAPKIRNKEERQVSPIDIPAEVTCNFTDQQQLQLPLSHSTITSIPTPVHTTTSFCSKNTVTEPTNRPLECPIIIFESYSPVTTPKPTKASYITVNASLLSESPKAATVEKKRSHHITNNYKNKNDRPIFITTQCFQDKLNENKKLGKKKILRTPTITAVLDNDSSNNSCTIDSSATLIHYPANICNEYSPYETLKRYKCVVCEKKFIRPSSLTTHMYSHTGEKPFQCMVNGCGRKFSVISNLRRHGKIHSSSSVVVTPTTATN